MIPHIDAEMRDLGSASIKEAMMKNVLLLVHDDAGQEARLQAALDLVRALDGHLSCVDVTVYPAIIADPYGGIVGDAMLLADERERESKNKTALDARLANEGVAWDWTDTTDNFVGAVLWAAPLADIVVLDRNHGQFPYRDMRGVISQVLTHARIPVLAVPGLLERLKLDRALIAWDGHTSCAATMRACVPLLRRAEAVELLMVRDSAEAIEPTKAAAYLSRHGIHASVRVIEDTRQTPDHHIEAEAKAFRADYVVMGAYGHGRLMEAFGGVTKRMLANAKLPLVLGH
jgi:nucleotide-binding universal stress UspA family protein